MRTVMKKSFVVSSAVAALGLGACTDAPLQPADRTTGSSASEAASLAVLHGRGAGSVIDGQYVIIFRNDVPDAPGLARKLASEEAGQLRHTYTHAVKGFSARLTAQAAQRLARNPRVAYVEEDQVVRASGTQSSPTWGLDRVDQRALPLSGSFTYTPTGAGVTVYIIDTGLRFDHSEFGGRAHAGFDAIADGRAGADCNGHGTHVGGTVGGATYGVAKGVKLVGVRVLDCEGSGTLSGVIAGLDWVTANASKPAVANMSLGGGISQALDDAVRRSIATGVAYAIAAGNENIDACAASPARVAEALTVGASTSSDARATYSNYGTCLDLFAPGSSVTSAWYTGATATGTISGTSMAAPHVAGTAALYLEGNPTAAPGTVATAILSSATTGALAAVGTGSPNKLLFSPLTTAGADAGSGAPSIAPCTSCTMFTGTLSGPGAAHTLPNGTHYYSATSGSHRAWLRGPAGTDFDLYLYKWNSYWGWMLVARAENATSEEQISYSGTAGYYRWQVRSYSGSGSYSFWMQKP